MTVKSTFISQPSVAFSVLLQACDEVLPHKVNQGVDTTVKRLSDSERFLSILSAMQDPDAPVGLPPNLLTHISFSVLTIAADADMMDVLECCSGMPFIYSETKLRGVLIAVITGTMQQWRDAVVSGTNHAESSIRAGFNQIHNLFVEVGLCQIWNDYEQRPGDDDTYELIEYRP